MIQTKLAGKIVLVTGANHGIGAATARAFAAEGAKVLISYLRMPPPEDAISNTIEDKNAPGPAFYNKRRVISADATVQKIHAMGGHAEAIEADLSDTATIPMLFDRAEALFGPVDVLVNNADHCEQDTFIPQNLAGNKDLAPDGFPTRTITATYHDQHFAVNSRAVALMMAEFAQRHIAQDIHWGRIINVSTDGAPGFAGEISYGASKAALESYSRAAAKELGRYGITVNIISPGPVQTGWITPELEKIIGKNTPLGRVGQPEDLADVIVFLASEQARWITGQLISVSGGHRMVIG
ncbi:MAG TPA: SDR family oxidoreductase [Ktedonobacteraceae bacterium]|jgi:3-oxoacyl-[acyl-carrier protein] reductase